MGILNWIYCLLVLTGSCQAIPFLWPSSFRGSSTTTTTTTTHTGPPHPHAQNNHGTGTTPVIGHSHSSHLHVRPAITSSYLTNRPLPPLVGAHHHHNNLRPAVTSPNTHLHVHGGSTSGPSATGYTSGFRHHYHLHQQHHHQHHPHSSARVLHSHMHPAALHFPLAQV